MKLIKQISSNKIKGLKRECPKCRDGTMAVATGNILKYDNSDLWDVEYLCPFDGELIKAWNVKHDVLIASILKDNGIDYIPRIDV